MDSIPNLISTNLRDETFSGLKYHIQGELCPALIIELSAGNSVYFEHDVLLWKAPSISIHTKAMGNVLKRMVAGLQIFMTEAAGEGHISFSRDASGHIVPLHLRQGETIHVREHQFLAASQNINYSVTSTKGLVNLVAGRTGLFIDHFQAKQGDGIVWVHGYGNVFEKQLAAGEQLEVEPGAWLYKDESVRMETVALNLAAGLFASANVVMNRFTGPGRLGIQTMYFTPVTTKR